MPNLDLLRSIAVTIVVVQHTLLTMHIHRIGAWDVDRLGIVGVFMFFVHTALVLMWSLERNPHVVNFYIRRIFRIYPLAIAAILITVSFHLPTLHNGNGDTYYWAPDAWTFIVNLLLLQNIFLVPTILIVMWTLPLELNMYLLLPFFGPFTEGRFALARFLVLWAVVVAADSYLFRGETVAFAVCIPYFLSGVIAYTLFSRVQSRLPAFLLPIFLFALVSCYMFRPTMQSGWWLTLVLGMALPFFRSIRAGWLVACSHHLAKYSYAIYLVHPFCIAFGFVALQRYDLAIRIAGLILLMAAIVVPAYHFLEKPMIDLGARLGGRAMRVREAPVAAG